MDIVVEGGKVARAGGLENCPIFIADGYFTERTKSCTRRLLADGLVVLPGAIDIHGDAFERQIMPRPGVHIDLDVALLETDRQLIANGITTAFHGVTWSWEPGLRGAENAHLMVDAIERLREEFGADTRLHLRHETYNLDSIEVISEWLASGKIGILAFNDHAPELIAASPDSKKFAELIKRTGLPPRDITALLEKIARRANDVPGAIARLAAAATSAAVPTFSHDDRSPEERRWYRELKCTVSEFPKTVETAREAVDCAEATVFGAPNVLRGGSHVGCPAAREMVERGLCTALASDYYYPALLLAPFKLARDLDLPLAETWKLVSSGPAMAAGLTDRGEIEEGRRGDLILVDAERAVPRVVATIVEGRIVYLTEPNRMSS